MTHRERLRRAGILCCHCLRNIAFYRSWNKAGRPFSKHQFLINLNGNFLDIAVLEWCKLFADTRGKHHYCKVVAESAAFMTDALRSLNLTAAEFDAYVDSMKKYRDKFVAHLDELDTMKIPSLDIATKITEFLYQRLLAQESRTDTFHDAPQSAAKFYKDFVAQGKQAYASRLCCLTLRSS